MTNYTNFAYYYDKMMADVDYDAWLFAVEKHVKKGGRLLDVGCGTGTLALALCARGYEVDGVDLSADMLVVAKEKAERQGHTLNLIEGDMCELAEFSGYDGVVIAVDSLNYLETEEQVQATFAGAHAALLPGGTLLFDVHTPFKMTQVFDDYLYVENDAALTYIWHVAQGEVPLSIVHELTLFAPLEDGRYARTVEVHHQRTFESDQYEAWLVQAGFQVVRTWEEDARRFFVAQKKGG